MKKEYPTFKKGDSDKVYSRLKGSEKNVFDKYLKEVGSHSSKGREDKVRLFLLQLRDVIQKPLTKINRDDIFHFLTLLNRSTKSNWTKNDVKKIVKHFL
ncbi:hypothetical protein HOI04_02205, partial [archaeon]|nr:hypothetical protein [archaeon]